MLVDVETLALGRRVLERIDAGETDGLNASELDAADAVLALALEEERLRSCAKGG